MSQELTYEGVGRRQRLTLTMRVLLVVLTLIVTSTMAATPAIDGAIREVHDAPGRPVPGTVYKLVFDMNMPQDAMFGLNPGLRGLSDLIAEYTAYGTDATHRSIVVVLHGAYTELALTNDAYRRLHNGADHPSIAQMQALQRLGVAFTAPATELTALTSQAEDIQAGIKPGPRASLSFLTLEAAGYVYDGTKSLTGK
ncbi:intracellular sulfur oxidation DsrE/DsrF family protein [Luteibacter sp. 1214]|uniref:hypothetical protein n=1 Tax=Luteibacter sp. 1214 TaxID=2817735 RepID=UPI002855D82D|nr:hypothetical protein [Luteibacter sp. 1214]MDR6641123.1 intracellular sulfur oxidation DsrE/DsrF family protein [Luteibacter sp. 1214]